VAEGGIRGFLSESRRLASAGFATQYAAVRTQDGHREVFATFWHDLPRLPRRHPAAAEWRIRRESFDTLLAHAVDWSSGRRVLDLGAGCGWLSARLAERGHAAVALDRLDDEDDGRGLRQQGGASFVAVCADFDALPFEPGQFDVVIFNASLHYAREPERTLEFAVRMLAPGGSLVVMDSPTFARAADGESMVATQLATLGGGVRSGVGYLTFALLDAVAIRLGRQSQFIASHGPLSWRVRRALARQRLGREPATFGVWVAR
jgi:SAM-dependent methyltransferase